MNPEKVFPIFFGTWVVLGIVSFVFFHLGKNAQLKRKIWAPSIIGIGLLFLLFVYLMGVRGEVFFVAVAAVALISFINIKATKFCDACGKTIIKQNILAETNFCSKCGEEL